jgi:serine protease Do
VVFDELIKTFAVLSLILVSPAGAHQMVLLGNSSGFFITSDGYFITNFHVVREADDVRVIVGNERFQARVVNGDSSNDLALLKVEGSGFACLPLGKDLDVCSGEAVFTVGFPAACWASYSASLLSKKRRDVREHDSAQEQP